MLQIGFNAISIYSFFFSTFMSMAFLSPAPEASSEESPSADEEQAASSAAAEAKDGDDTGETQPTENGEKSDEGATTEKGDEGSEKKEWVYPES